MNEGESPHEIVCVCISSWFDRILNHFNPHYSITVSLALYQTAALISDKSAHLGRTQMRVSWSTLSG